MATKKRAAASKVRKAKGSERKKSKTPEIQIGEKVRGLRKQKGLSIQKLADLSGVSPAGIYKIETNGMVPTITTLVKLARALEHRVTYFVEEEETLPDVRYIRKSDRSLVASGQEGKTEVVAEKLSRGSLDGICRTLEPGARSRNPSLRPGGEQFVYCLKGELSVVRGDDSFRLKEGDTLHFHMNGRVQFENTGRSMTNFLVMHAPLAAN
ncbi:MAG: XRE family transcriptional regulator [bacterium]